MSAAPLGQREPAPPNSLPNFDQCARLIENSKFRARAAACLEGAVLTTLGQSPEPTELHRFIYEYDDADAYRSAWFMHRLEKLIEEVRAEAKRAAPTALDHFIADVEAAGSEKPQPLTKTKVINIINKLRNKYPYPGGNGLRFDIELARAIEAAHGIYPSPAAMEGEQP